MIKDADELFLQTACELSNKETILLGEVNTVSYIEDPIRVGEFAIALISHNKYPGQIFVFAVEVFDYGADDGINLYCGISPLKDDTGKEIDSPLFQAYRAIHDNNLQGFDLSGRRFTSEDDRKTYILSQALEDSQTQQFTITLWGAQYPDWDDGGDDDSRISDNLEADIDLLESVDFDDVEKHPENYFSCLGDYFDFMRKIGRM